MSDWSGSTAPERPQDCRLGQMSSLGHNPQPVRAFLDGDLNYLANLCHSCDACYFDGQCSPRMSLV
jgi:hypothetical protein